MISKITQLQVLSFSVNKKSLMDNGTYLKKLFTVSIRAIITLLVFVLSTLQSDAQILPTTNMEPYIDFAVHNQGNIQAVVSNLGSIGGRNPRDIKDPFTGEFIKGLIYPRNSDIFYGRTELWVGARVGNEYIVSSGAFFDGKEFYPDIYPFGEIALSSIDFNRPIFSSEANAEMDITSVYFDTLTDLAYVPLDLHTLRPHSPLGIRVTERSMSWSGENIDDFILYNFEITNIGDKLLSDVYVGFLNTVVALHELDDPVKRCQELVGYIKEFRDFSKCGPDSVNIAYWMDNDGDPSGTEWTDRSPLSVLGLRVLGSPLDSLGLNFNWWTSKWIVDTTLNPFGNWGPRLQETPDDPFRKLGSGLGYPEGDANKYYIMSHKEFDYDQMFLAVSHFFDGWLHPPEYRNELASGGCSESVLSFGVGGLGPGATMTFTVALVGGDSVHVQPDRFRRPVEPRKPT